MPIVHSNSKGFYMRLCCRRRFIRSLLMTYIILYIYICNYIILYKKILLLIIILATIKSKEENIKEEHDINETHETSEEKHNINEIYNINKEKHSINEPHNINKVHNNSIKPYKDSIYVKAEVPVILRKDMVSLLVTSPVHIEHKMEKILSIRSRPKVDNYTIIKGDNGELYLFASGTVYTTIDYATDKEQSYKVKYATQRNIFKFSKTISTDRLLNNNPLNMELEKVDLYSNLKNHNEDLLLCIDIKLYFNINQKQVVNLYSIPY